MRVFLYEFVIGGGFAGMPEGALLTEGLAMATALSNDFARIPQVKVDLMVDQRLERAVTSLTSLRDVTIHWIDSRASHEMTMNRLLQQCDAALVIAPEISGNLQQITRLAAEYDITLLSPSPETVSLFADKQKTASWLREQDIASPAGCLLKSANDLPAGQSLSCHHQAYRWCRFPGCSDRKRIA